MLFFFAHNIIFFCIKSSVQFWVLLSNQIPLLSKISDAFDLPSQTLQRVLCTAMGSMTCCARAFAEGADGSHIPLPDPASAITECCDRDAFGPFQLQEWQS